MFRYIKASHNLSNKDYIYRLIWLINRNPELYEKFMCDTLESGVLKIRKNNQEEYIFSCQTLEVIKGLLFESRIVDIANCNNNVKKALYLKSTLNKRVAQNHLDKFEIIGTGLISTKRDYPQFYNPNDSRDAIFIRPNYKPKSIKSSIVLSTSEIKPLQIKVSRNESYLRNDVDSMIIGKYNGLMLTCLQDYDYIHTRDKCIEYVKSLKDERKITYMERKYSLNKEVRNNIISSIICPDDICIPQQYINEYEEFVNCWILGASEVKNDQLYANVESALICLNELVEGKDVGIGFEIPNHHNYSYV